jgi:hypothetical protein
MSTEKLPRLHEGSRWQDDSILDDTNTEIGFDEWRGQKYILITDNQTRNDCMAWPEDLLAILRPIDPVAIAAHALCMHLDELEQHCVVGLEVDCAKLRDKLRAALEGSDG